MIQKILNKFFNRSRSKDISFYKKRIASRKQVSNKLCFGRHRNLSCEVLQKDCFEKASLIDISITGCAIKTKTKFNMDEFLSFCIQELGSLAPFTNPINVTCQTVYSIRTQDNFYRTGIRFKEISHSDICKINSFID